MKYRNTIILSALLFLNNVCFSQGQPLVSAGFNPATTNQPGKQYPQVSADGRVRASILAPQALKVQLDIGGKKYDMTKDTAGVWTGESLPQDEGFSAMFGIHALYFPRYKPPH